MPAARRAASNYVAACFQHAGGSNSRFELRGGMFSTCRRLEEPLRITWRHVFNMPAARIAASNYVAACFQHAGGSKSRFELRGGMFSTCRRLEEPLRITWRHVFIM